MIRTTFVPAKTRSIDVDREKEKRISTPISSSVATMRHAKISTTGENQPKKELLG